MASRAIKYPEKKSWTKPELRGLVGEEAERARRIMLESHGPDVFKKIESPE